jgi:hypothetical protein
MSTATIAASALMTRRRSPDQGHAQGWLDHDQADQRGGDGESQAERADPRDIGGGRAGRAEDHRHHHDERDLGELVGLDLEAARQREPGFRAVDR